MKKLLLALSSCCLFATAYATEDYCSQIPGQWEAVYHIVGVYSEFLFVNVEKNSDSNTMTGEMYDRKTNKIMYKITSLTCSEDKIPQIEMNIVDQHNNTYTYDGNFNPDYKGELWFVLDNVSTSKLAFDFFKKLN